MIDGSGCEKKKRRGKGVSRLHTESVLRRLFGAPSLLMAPPRSLFFYQFVHIFYIKRPSRPSASPISRGIDCDKYTAVSERVRGWER